MASSIKPVDSDPEALKVQKRYIDLEGLTNGDCDHLKYDTFTCDLLQDTFHSDDEILTSKKQDNLLAAGFSRAFVRTLAGVDVTGSLLRRVRWLKDHFPNDETGYDQRKFLSLFNKFGANAKEALPILITCLRPEVPEENQKMAIRSIGNLGSAAKETIPILLQMLQDPKRSYDEIIVAFGKMGELAKSSVPFLRKILRNEEGLTPAFSERRRLAAAWALLQIGERSFEVLNEVMALLEENVRGFEGAIGHAGFEGEVDIIYLFKKLGSQVAPYLRNKLVTTQNPKVKVAILNIFVENKEVSALPDIYASLDDQSKSADQAFTVARYAVDALSELGMPAIDYLLSALNHTDQEVSEGAKGGLLSLGVNALPKLLETLEKSDSNTQLIIIYIISYSEKNVDVAFPRLVQIYPSIPSAIREEFIKLFALVKTPECTAFLISLLNQPDVNEQVASILSRRYADHPEDRESELIYSDISQIPKLRALLRSNQPFEIKKVALLLLGKIGNDAQEADIDVLNLIETPELRLDAERVLEKFNPISARVIIALVQMLNSSEIIGFSYALRTLLQLGKAVWPDIEKVMMKKERQQFFYDFCEHERITEPASDFLMHEIENPDLEIQTTALKALTIIFTQSRKYLREEAWGEQLGEAQKKGVNVQDLPDIAIPPPTAFEARLLDHLTSRLNSSNPKLQEATLTAIQVMADLEVTGAESLLPSLRQISINHSDPKQRELAVNAFLKLSHDPAEEVKLMTQALADSSAKIRIQVADELTRVGKEAEVAIPSLLTLMRYADVETAFHVNRALACLGSERPDVYLALFNGMDDDRPEIVSGLAHAFGWLKVRSPKKFPQLSQSVVVEVKKSLKSPDVKEKQKGAWGIFALQTQEITVDGVALDLLPMLLENHPKMSRWGAIAALYSMGKRKLLESLGQQTAVLISAVSANMKSGDVDLLQASGEMLKLLASPLEGTNLPDSLKSLDASVMQWIKSSIEAQNKN